MKFEAVATRVELESIETKPPSSAVLSAAEQLERAACAPLSSWSPPPAVALFPSIADAARVSRALAPLAWMPPPPTTAELAVTFTSVRDTCPW